MTVAAEPGIGVAALWRLLALGFTPPSEDTVAEIEALAEGLVDLDEPSDVDDVLATVCGAHVDELASQFHSLFGGTVRVPPYEGSYELDPIRQGRQMADIAGFYRAFGAEAHGPAAERPDHAGCELEFLAFLELRRLAADETGDENARVLDEIGTTFLHDHAGRWLPSFFADVREAAERFPFYRALAALGTRVIGTELGRRELEPGPLPRRARRLAVERDTFDCGGQ